MFWARGMWLPPVDQSHPRCKRADVTAAVVFGCEVPSGVVGGRVRCSPPVGGWAVPGGLSERG